ncbi:MAG: hypothetical protein DRP57_12090 [Spirochaetes bacterium]|nr:MAG: hypothetical protein DRP57_12090 [Spirochaetota bacterium]
MVNIPKDFRELLLLLNKNRVKYLVIEGYAVAFYGAPRFTGDMDLFIDTSKENVKRIMKSLGEFGFTDPDLSAADFETPDMIIQLGVPPLRIDFVTSIDGVSWSTAWDKKASGSLGDVSVFFIGKNELLTNKRKTGRKKDLADIEALNPD